MKRSILSLIGPKQRFLEDYVSRDASCRFRQR
jgi:hypothetical protein